eukprot:s1442_g18.t1
MRGGTQNAVQAPGSLPEAMIQALAAFSGGLWVQNKLSDLQLPQLSRRINEAESFKLSVQVVAASIPGLTDSGLLTRERPRVAALLNGVRKETEFGDCDPEENDLLALPGTDNLPPCDWHFNETLTFAVTVADVLAGQSVQLWIHTYSDVRIGPFQVNLTRARDIGVCSVELQKQVLPDCVPSEESGDSTRHQETPRKRGSYSWETPVLPFPSSYSFLRRCLTAAGAKTTPTPEVSLREQRVEKELQKMRVAFFHARGRFAVHFTFLLMLAMAVNFVCDPSLRAFSSALFWTLLYSYFAIFHSLNMIEAPAGWQVSCFYVLFLHLFLVSNHWYWSALDLTESNLDALPALIPSERFHAVSLTLICSLMFDSKLTVPWCCFQAALQFCKSCQRFGLSQCISLSVLCQEISVQFLTIMPIIAIEKLVRLKIEAALDAWSIWDEKQNESSMVSGFRHVLRGVCDGDILLDSSYKILEDGTSLDRLLGHPKGTSTGTSLVNLFTVDDCKRFVRFVTNSLDSSAGSVPRGFRVTMMGRQGRPVAMDLFHVPIRGHGFNKGCNHLLAIKQDADQVIPDAPLEARGVPSCFKTLTPGGRRIVETGEGSVEVCPGE